MSDFTCAEWRQLEQQHASLANLAQTLKSERARADAAEAALASAKSNIEYTLEQYLRALDELSLIEYDPPYKPESGE